MTRSICFVGTDSYPVLNHNLKEEFFFGGEAIQQTLLARAFRDYGYRVSMVCLDYGQKQGEIREDIQIIKTYRQNAGIPILRFLYPRLWSVLAALKRADADVYFQSCAGVNTGYVARFCKQHSKKFIYRIASDSDCDPDSHLIQLYRDKKIYEYGLMRADVVSAQSQHQQTLLARNYSLKSHVINMVCEIPSATPNISADIDVLWVSNIRECKRPDTFLKLARAMPERNFTMIGGVMVGEQALFDEVTRAAESIPNLEFLGAVRYHEIGNFFARSKIFVNTSDIEGFPNTFLQAWAQKIPVISFLDPDNLIDTKMLGLSPDDIEEMELNIDLLLRNDAKRAAMGDAGYQFIIANYSSKAVVQEYDRLITSLNAGESAVPKCG